MVDHMPAFTLIADIVGNHMLMCVHTDDNHSDTATFPTKQKHTHIYEKCCLKKKKKDYLSKKPIAKLRPHQMTGASQRASCAVTRACQNSNKQSSTFFLDGLILSVTLHATKPCCFFYHEYAVFEHNLFHNGHKQ